MITIASLESIGCAPRKKPGVAEVVEILKQCEQPEMPVTHHFSPGIYCREIFMPALPGGGR